MNCRKISDGKTEDGEPIARLSFFINGSSLWEK
jgi:hypothetical protein